MACEAETQTHRFELETEGARYHAPKVDGEPLSHVTRIEMDGAVGDVPMVKLHVLCIDGRLLLEDAHVAIAPVHVESSRALAVIDAARAVAETVRPATPHSRRLMAELHLALGALDSAER